MLQFYRLHILEKMAPVIELSNVFSDDAKASADKFISMIMVDKSQFSKKDILLNLNYIIDSMNIPLSLVLREYDLTFADIKSQTDILRRIYAHSVEEFDSVIKTLRKDKCDIIQTLVKMGYAYLIKRVIQVLKISRDYCITIVQMALFVDEWEIINWATDEFQITPEEMFGPDSAELRHLISEGKLDVMRTLCSRYKITKEMVTSHDNRAFQVAAQNGDLEMLGWITREFELNSYNAKAGANVAFHLAAEKGHIKVLEWLTNTFDLAWGDNITPALEKAIVSGQRSTFMWIIKRFKLTARNVNNFNLMRLIIDFGEVELMEWLTNNIITEEDLSFKGPDAFEAAATKGHFKMLQWICEWCGIQKSDFNSEHIFKEASKMGYLDVLKWLTEHFKLTAKDITTDHSIPDWLKSGVGPIVSDWIINEFKLVDSTNKIPTSEIKFVISLPQGVRRSVLHSLIEHNHDISNEDIKVGIDSIRDSGLAFYDSMKEPLLSKIVEVYGLSEKPRDEALKILESICRANILTDVIRYLDKTGILQTNPSITIEDVKKMFPEYNIMLKNGSEDEYEDEFESDCDSLDGF